MKNSKQLNSMISLPAFFQESIMLKEIELSKGTNYPNTIYDLIDLYIVKIIKNNYFYLWIKNET